jgi:hypothetical protein
LISINGFTLRAGKARCDAPGVHSRLGELSCDRISRFNRGSAKGGNRERYHAIAARGQRMTPIRLGRLATTAQESTADLSQRQGADPPRARGEAGRHRLFMPEAVEKRVRDVRRAVFFGHDGVEAL